MLYQLEQWKISGIKDVPTVFDKYAQAMGQATWRKNMIRTRLTNGYFQTVRSSEEKAPRNGQVCRQVLSMNTICTTLMQRWHPAFKLGLQHDITVKKTEPHVVEEYHF